METWERLFGLDAQTVFDALVLAVNIFLLFMLLSYILFDPVREFLKKRQDKIQSDLSSAKKNKEDAQQMKEEYEAKIRQADMEASAILKEARQKAMKNEEAIIAQAKQEAARIIERGNAQVELERKKAADEMKVQMIEIATAMASKMVAVSMTPAKQEELFHKTLEEIGDDTWQN